MKLNNFIRKISFSSINLTKTIWAMTRVKVRQPKCYIPRYLLDGGLKKGHGKSGRNKTGRKTARHRKHPGRRNYRLIDFLRVSEFENENKIFRDQVIGIAYDPCRSAMIAKTIGESSNRYRLILAATGMKKGDIVLSSRGPPPPGYRFCAGDTFPLKYIPQASAVYNVETYPGSSGKMARSGDSKLIISGEVEKNGKKFISLIREGRKIIVSGNCLASFGSALTNRLKYLPYGKAGRAIRYGKIRSRKTGILRHRNKPQRGRKNLLTTKK